MPLSSAASDVYKRQPLLGSGPEYIGWGPPAWQYRSQAPRIIQEGDIVLSEIFALYGICLLYTSDAADDRGTV
nr:hypothetical protein [Elizabethkingia sp. ASV34]